jgi:hypothetical protein
LREELKNIDGIRTKFTAVFVRYGTKPAYKGPPIKTLLFENVRSQLDQQVTDHIWFTTNKQFEKYAFDAGDLISFEARVKPYLKGYRGSRGDVDSYPSKDYKLSHPTNIFCSKPDLNQTKLF